MLFDDPMEALHYILGGKNGAFICPMARCVDGLGWEYAKKGWHPFVETTRQYIEGEASSFDESILKEFYDLRQPENASKAIPALELQGELLGSLVPYAIRCRPWMSKEVRDVISFVHSAQASDAIEHGDPHLTVHGHGHSDFGPVHPKKGELEFKRLVRLVSSIGEGGYDRGHGDVHVQILKRGNDVKFLRCGTGCHRTAVVSALGYETIPATLRKPYIIDVSDVCYWPQVRNGIWEREDAIRYFNHLFDFDSRQWASEQGLLLEQQ